MGILEVLYFKYKRNKVIENIIKLLKFHQDPSKRWGLLKLRQKAIQATEFDDLRKVETKIIILNS